MSMVEHSPGCYSKQSAKYPGINQSWGPSIRCPAPKPWGKQKYRPGVRWREKTIQKEGLQQHPSLLCPTPSCSSTFLIFTTSKRCDSANENLWLSVRCACHTQLAAAAPPLQAVSAGFASTQLPVPCRCRRHIPALRACSGALQIKGKTQWGHPGRAANLPSPAPAFSSISCSFSCGCDTQERNRAAQPPHGKDRHRLVLITIPWINLSQTPQGFQHLLSCLPCWHRPLLTSPSILPPKPATT